MPAKTEKRSFFKKLTDKYRLIILDEDTFEHKVDVSLSRLNVFVAVGLLSIFLIALTTFLIASTKLKEYIPGYPSTDLKKNVYLLVNKLDSLNREVEIRDQYLNQLRMILTGDLAFNRWDSIVHKNVIISPDSLELEPSKEDLSLRDEVESGEKFSVEKNEKTLQKFRYIAPIKGLITRHFNIEKKHFGVDIVTSTNTPVKSVEEGTVIFSNWTSDAGNVIIIAHPDNTFSAYKHNQKLLKSTGDRVKKGEVIAMAGDTGENSTGPHLHFELWKNNRPVNPEDYIFFGE